MKPGSSMRVAKLIAASGWTARISASRRAASARMGSRQAAAVSVGRKRTSPEKVQSRAVMLLAVPPSIRPTWMVV